MMQQPRTGDSLLTPDNSDNECHDPHHDLVEWLATLDVPSRFPVPQVVSIQAHHCCTTMMFDLPTILLPTAVYQVLSAARIFREHDLLHSPADRSTISHDKLICEYLHMYTEVSSLSYSQTHVASQESTAQWIPLLDFTCVSQQGARRPGGLFPHDPASCTGNMAPCCRFGHPTSLDSRRCCWAHHIGQASLGSRPVVLSPSIPWIW